MATNKLALRVFGTSGVQMSVMSLHGLPYGLCAHKNLLAVVFHKFGSGIGNEQHLGYIVGKQYLCPISDCMSGSSKLVSALSGKAFMQGCVLVQRGLNAYHFLVAFRCLIWRKNRLLAVVKFRSLHNPY